jgi:sugar/nucleoside kinase (ribokinase family)
MSVTKQFDLVCVGNAIVDILAKVPDGFITKHGLTKGAMMLVEPEQAARLYADMKNAEECSGGSAANSAAVLASLGGKGAFIGRVANDQFGTIFVHDMTSLGMAFTNPVRDTQLPTGSSLIAVTDDGQRTMNTSLGCNVNFGPADLPQNVIEQSKVVLLEGYLFDKPECKKAFREAVKLAKSAGSKVALTLSAQFCVSNHREDFLNLLKDGVDILFANEEEVVELYQAANWDEAAGKAAKAVPVAVLTRGSKGARIHMEGVTVDVPAHKVQVVDTTGAGDAYAGGFLYGYTHGKDATTCGQIATLCAAEVISHLGPRPQTNLAQYVSQKLALPRAS